MGRMGSDWRFATTQARIEATASARVFLPATQLGIR
jgi:hypothetical protein